jgi:hypothetical protein
MKMRKAFLAVFAASVVKAWRLNGAVSTKGYTLIATSISPVPTQAPLLRVRDAVSGQVCGYIGGQNSTLTTPTCGIER